jgi:hypothetical protein
MRCECGGRWVNATPDGETLECEECGAHTTGARALAAFEEMTDEAGMWAG